MTAPVRPADGSCSRWLGAAYCGATETHYFAVGHRCRAHTPAALAGQPEPPAGPGIPAYQREAAA
jgi:hypothetical protein